MFSVLIKFLDRYFGHLIRPKPKGFIVFGITRDSMMDDSDIGDDYLYVNLNHYEKYRYCFCEVEDKATVFPSLKEAEKAVAMRNNFLNTDDPLITIQYIEV